MTAADWLDRRLAMTEGEARSEVAARLAAAYLAAGQRHRAIACLERALDEFPRADRLRTMLADLYRDAQSWEPLARVLGDGCDHGDDDAVTVARASRGRGDLRAPRAAGTGRPGAGEGGTPGAAARGAWAGAGRRAGPLRPPRRGARRSSCTWSSRPAGGKTRKRGVLHQRLAGIARAQGDTALALVELEQASSMDASSPEILTQLAEVAEAAGDLDKRRARVPHAADAGARRRAVRARRPRAPGLALTEILLRLHGLARKRGHAGEADELLDSALAAAIKDPEQASRLQRGLLQAGAHDELARLFEKRLAHAAGTPAEAEVSAEMADCLRAQGRHEAAFDAQLRAVEAAPEIAHRHRPLVELARTTGRLEQLVERLLALVERRRRKADMGVASTLLLLAADIAEHDFGDRKRALELHRRAEEMQPQSLGVLSGIARLAARARRRRRVRPGRRPAQARRRRGAQRPGRRGRAVPGGGAGARAAGDARRRHRQPVRSAGQEPRRRARRRRWSRRRACRRPSW